MSIKDFFNSLLPSFERNRITEDVAALRKELHESVVPAYQRAEKVMASHPLRNAQAIAFQNDFNKALPDMARFGLVSGSRRIFAELDVQLRVIDELVESTFAKDVTKETMTFQKVTILRYLELARFATTYSTRLLLWLTEVESNAALNKEAASTLTPAELTWLTDNKRTYLFEVLPVLDQTAQELKQTLKGIPEITVVPERMDLMRQTIGAHKLDPLQLGFIGTRYSPIYHLRMYYSEWQVKRYKAMLEEKRALEFRLLALQEAYDGKENAKLEQAIQYSQGRLQRLNYELARLEERYLED